MSGQIHDISFPVYVLTKDSGDVMEFPSLPAMQGYLEPIDVEKDEYEAWDNNRSVLRLAVSKPKSAWLNIIRTEDRISEQEFLPLRNRAEAYRERESLWKSFRHRFAKS